MVNLTLSTKASIDHDIDNYMNKFDLLLKKGDIGTEDISKFFTRLTQKWIINVDYNYLSYVYNKFSVSLKERMEQYKKDTGVTEEDEVYAYTVELIRNMINQSTTTNNSYEELVEEFYYQQNMMNKMQSNYLENNNDVLLNINTGLGYIRRKAISLLKLQSLYKDNEDKNTENTKLNDINDSLKKIYNIYLENTMNELNLLTNQLEEEPKIVKKHSKELSNTYNIDTKLREMVWVNELVNNKDDYMNKIQNGIDKKAYENFKEYINYKDIPNQSKLYESMKKISMRNLFEKVKEDKEVLSKIYDYIFKYYDSSNKEQMFVLLQQFEGLQQRCRKLANTFGKKLDDVVKNQETVNKYIISHRYTIDMLFDEMYDIFDFYYKVETLYEKNLDVFNVYNRISNKKIDPIHINNYIKNHILIKVFYPYLIMKYFPNSLKERYEKRRVDIKKKGLTVKKYPFAEFTLDTPIVNDTNTYYFEDVYYSIINQLIVTKPKNIKTHLYFYKHVHEMMHEQYEGDTTTEIFEGNGPTIDSSIYEHFKNMDDDYIGILAYKKYWKEIQYPEMVMTPKEKWLTIEKMFNEKYNMVNYISVPYKVKKMPFDITLSTVLLEDEIYQKFFEKEGDLEEKDPIVKKFLSMMGNVEKNNLIPGFITEKQKPFINGLLKLIYLENKNIKDVEDFIKNRLMLIDEMPSSEEKIREYFGSYNDDEYEEIIDETPNYFNEILANIVQQNKDNLTRMRTYFNKNKDNLVVLLEGKSVYYDIPANQEILVTSYIENIYMSVISLNNMISLENENDDTIFYYIKEYYERHTKYLNVYANDNIRDAVKSLTKTYSDIEKNQIIRSVTKDFFIIQLIKGCLKKKNYKMTGKVLEYVQYTGIFKYTNEDYRQSIEAVTELKFDNDTITLVMNTLPNHNRNTFINISKKIIDHTTKYQIQRYNIHKFNRKESIEKVIQTLTNSIENENMESVGLLNDEIDIFKFYGIDLNNDYKEEYKEKFENIIKIYQNKLTFMDQKELSIINYDHNIKVLEKMIEDKSLDSKIEVDEKKIGISDFKKNKFDVSIKDLFTLHGITKGTWSDEWEDKLNKIIEYLKGRSMTIESTNIESNAVSSDALLLEMYDNIDKDITFDRIIEMFVKIGNKLDNTANQVNINMVMVIVHKILYTLYVNPDQSKLGNILYDVQLLAKNWKKTNQYAAILFLASLRKLSNTDINKSHLIHKLNVDKKKLKKMNKYLTDNNLFSYSETVQDKTQEKKKNEKLTDIIAEFRKKNTENKENIEEKIKNLKKIIDKRKKNKEDVSSVRSLVINSENQSKMLSKRNRTLYALFKSDVSLSDLYVSKRHFIEHSYSVCDHVDVKKEIVMLNNRQSNTSYLLNEAREKLKEDKTNSSIKKNIDDYLDRLEIIRTELAQVNSQFESFLTGKVADSGSNSICNRCGEVIASNLEEYGKGSFEEQQEVREMQNYIRESNLMPIMKRESEITSLVNKARHYVRAFKDNDKIKINKPNVPGFTMNDIDFTSLYSDNVEDDKKSIMYEYMDTHYNQIYAMAAKYVRSSFKFINVKKMNNKQLSKVKMFIDIYFRMATYIQIIYFLLSKDVSITLENGQLRSNKPITYLHVRNIYQLLFNRDKNIDKVFFDGFNIEKTFMESNQVNFYIKIYNVIIGQEIKFTESVKFKPYALIIMSKRKSDNYEDEISFHKDIRGNYLKPSPVLKVEVYEQEESIKGNEIVHKNYVRYMLDLRYKLNIIEDNDLEYFRMEKGEYSKQIENLSGKSRQDNSQKINEINKKLDEMTNIIDKGSVIKDCNVDLLYAIFLIAKLDYMKSMNKSEDTENETIQIENTVRDLLTCNMWDTNDINLSQFNKLDHVNIYNRFLTLYLHIQYSKFHKRSTGRKIKKTDPELANQIEENYEKWYEKYVDVMDVFKNYVSQDEFMVKYSDGLTMDYDVLSLYLLKLFEMYKNHIDYLVKHINLMKDANVSSFLTKNLRIHTNPSATYEKNLMETGFTFKNQRGETIQIESVQSFYENNKGKLEKLGTIQKNLELMENSIKTRIDRYDRFKNKIIGSNLMLEVKRANTFVNMMNQNESLYNQITKNHLNPDTYKKGLDDRYLPKNINLIIRLNFIRVSENVYLNTLVPYLFTINSDDSRNEMIDTFMKINNQLSYKLKKDTPIYIPSRESDDMSNLEKLYGFYYDQYLNNLYLFEPLNKDGGHYTVMGLNKSSTPNEIKKAYNKLAMKHHPDKGGDEEKFKELQAAYEILSNDNNRKAYDLVDHNVITNRISDMFTKDLENLVSELDKDNNFLNQLESKKINTDKYLETILDVKKTAKFEMRGNNKIFSKSVNKDRLTKFSNKNLRNAMDILKTKSRTIRESFKTMVEKYKKEYPELEKPKYLKVLSWNNPIISVDYNKSKELDLECDKECIKKYILYGKGDRLYLKDNKNSEYNEAKNTEFVKNMFKYFEINGYKLIKRKEPLNDEGALEAQSWKHVPHYDKWNKIRFDDNYICYAYLKSLIQKLEIYCVDNYIKEKDTVKEIYENVEEYEEINIDEDAIFGYYYTRNQKFLQDVFPLIDITKSYYPTKEVSLEEAKNKINELLGEYEIVKYHGKNTIIYGYNNTFYYEEGYKYEIDALYEEPPPGTILPVDFELVDKKPMWKRDKNSLIKLHRDYVRNKLNEYKLDDKILKLNELISNPASMYQYPELLKEYLKNYHSIIEKYNKYIDPVSNEEVERINKIKELEEYKILEFQLKYNENTITDEENNELLKLIEKKKNKIELENKKKRYEGEEKQDYTLNKLETQFMTGRIMKHTFRYINEGIIENLTENLMKLESNENEFENVFKMDESELKSNKLKSEYERAESSSLFKMYNNYKNGMDNTIETKFNNLFDYYPVVDKNEMTEYLKYEKEEDKKTPPYCYYLSIRNQIPDILDLSYEESELKTDDELITMYCEKNPHHNVLEKDGFILVCPTKTISQLKQQILDMSGFMDPIIDSMRLLSNGSYNAFLRNSESIMEMEQLMLSRIQTIGIEKETGDNLDNFILSFDLKSVRKFIDNSMKKVSNYNEKGETSLSMDNLDFKKTNTELNRLLLGEKVETSSSNYGITLSSMYETLEKLEAKYKEGDETVDLQLLRIIRKKIKDMERMQEQAIDKIDDNLRESSNKRSDDYENIQDRENDDYEDFEMVEAEDDDVDEFAEQEGYQEFKDDDDDVFDDELIKDAMKKANQEE